ncbi:hypothetical protein Q8A67_019009 [Cirrhinus molitorella]|uniref:Uncharacterized protein n=1 Tax=Cirrhinus molitorella TaxID=172907 RepID=A0AA88TFA6_9TELE|nr:hypothetical protein Q8A67_019009 [Cirrhinus molitorella]
MLLNANNCSDRTATPLLDQVDSRGKEETEQRNSCPESEADAPSALPSGKIHTEVVSGHTQVNKLLLTEASGEPRAELRSSPVFQLSRFCSDGPIRTGAVSELYDCVDHSSAHVVTGQTISGRMKSQKLIPHHLHLHPPLR